MTRAILALTLTCAALLAGCSTLTDALTNRAGCTLAGDRMLVVSMYGPIGVATMIDGKDAATVCRAKP